MRVTPRISRFRPGASRGRVGLLRLLEVLLTDHIPPALASHPGLSPWHADMIVGGRYRLVDLIGTGACAEVWRAEHTNLKVQVALKLVSAAGKDERDLTLARFLREAQATARVSSRHVVRILDQGTEGSTAFMAMELLEGESLQERLANVGRLPPKETARIVSQLAVGLETAHAVGLIHRDLKPPNIFLANDEGREVVKILDFGIAKRFDIQKVDPLATQEGFLVGTPCYMSPEQILGVSEVDRPSDLWQVAVVAYECVCGRRPFDGDAVGELLVSICSGKRPKPSAIAAVPTGFDEWFARATVRDPEKRFQSATELARALCDVLTPESSAAELADDSPTFVPSMAPPPPAASNHSLETVRATSRDATGLRARTLSRERALLITVAVAVPVAVLSTVLALWLVSRGPSSSATPAPSVSAAPSTSSRPVAEPATADPPDGGADPAGSAAASGSAAPDAGPARPATTYMRPEEMLGI